jgi:hypothetical protein
MHETYCPKKKVSISMKHILDFLSMMISVGDGVPYDLLSSKLIIMVTWNHLRVLLALFIPSISAAGIPPSTEYRYATQCCWWAMSRGIKMTEHTLVTYKFLVL